MFGVRSASMPTQAGTNNQGEFGTVTDQGIVYDFDPNPCYTDDPTDGCIFAASEPSDSRCPW